MKKTEVRSDWQIEDLAVKAIKEEPCGVRGAQSIFKIAGGHENALRALLVRLGYSPHNAFAHGKLVPLADDPDMFGEKCYPHQTPVLDK